MYTVTILRDQLSTVITNNSIGTDALNAVSTIPLCTAVKLVCENDEFAIIEYEYPNGSPKFWDTDTHLAEFGLKKKY